jgi:hypothetical protein
LKRYLLLFGYDRWSKIRSVSKQSCKLVSSKPDEEMRPYANMFIMHLANCLEKEPELYDRVLRIIEVKDSDVKIYASPSDYADNIMTSA